MSDGSARTGFRAWFATHHLEFVAILLAALATIGAAWAGYQAARWGGEAAAAFADANAARLEAARASARGGAQTQVDVMLFARAANAYAADEQELYDFYVDRFRDEFQPAFEAWLATRPLENPDAPATPFVLPEYRVAELEAAAALDAGAEGSAVQGKDAIQRSSNYVLSIVLFAAALFLCAIGPRFERPRLRIAVIVLGGAVFALTGIWIATLPVSVSL